MILSPEIEAFVTTFIEDLINDDVAIFAGAGLSKSAGFVDWPGLLRDLAKELGLQVEKEHDLISLAQYHINHRGNSSGLTRKILSEFSRSAQASKNHEILARLPISTYWTTNYDKLLESSLIKASKRVDVKYEIEQLADTLPERDAIVYKMHGDVDHPSKAILSKAHYEAYYRTHEPFITALSAALVSKTFLFIGFSFTDPNLDYVLSRLHTSTRHRQHYCFIKREAVPQDDDSSEVEAQKAYAQRKQALKIQDLKRYQIQALLIDEYDDITKILQEIERRYKCMSVFVSGSAKEYKGWTEEDAQKFIYALGQKLVAAKLCVVSGLGNGVGRALVHGISEQIYQNPRFSFDKQLVLRPFPKSKDNDPDRLALREKYCRNLMSLAGIAIFIFGNKWGEEQIINATGVLQEFGIAVEQKVVPIPVASTGYAAQEIYAKIALDPHKYYGEKTKIIWPLVQKLNDLQDPELLAEKLVALVLEIGRA